MVMRILKLPRLGQTMESGTIVDWMVEPGDTFEQGEVVYQVETEKVETEVEAPTSGTLVRVLVDAGREVPVQTALAVVSDPGTKVEDADVDAFLASLDDGPEPTGPASEPMPEAAPGGSTTREASAGDRARAMPAARKLAREEGVDLVDIAGSGPRGSVTVEDVRQAAASSRAGTTERSVAGVGEESGLPAVRSTGSGEALQGAARRMADHLARAWEQIPHFHEIIEIDVSGLGGVGAPDEPRITINDRLVAATAAAARAVPEVNATFENGHLIRHEDINVAVAVATDRGLLTPVVRRTDQLDLPGLSARLRDAAARARSGRMAVDELSGGTITVSNLGMYGVDTGTPIINHPQVALLFVGAIRDRAVVIDGDVVARPTVFLTLACDHRVVDGATAARFLAAVAAHLRASSA